MFSITFAFENAGPLHWGASLKLRADPHRESMPAPHQFETIRLHAQLPRRPGDAWCKKPAPHASPNFRPSPQPTQIKSLKQAQNNVRTHPAFCVSCVSRLSRPPLPEPGDSWPSKNPQKLSPKIHPSPQPTQTKHLNQVQNNARENADFPVSTVTRPWHGHSCLCSQPSPPPRYIMTQNA